MTSTHDLRAQLEAAVIADLLGPAGGPEEIVDERTVRDRYLVGKLGPKGQTLQPDEDDALTGDDIEGELDVGGVDGEDGVAEARLPAAVAVSMQPASLGLSFVAQGEAAALQLTARWGRYERVRVEDDAYRNKDGSLRPVWRRIPVEAVSPPIPLQAGKTTPWTPNPDQPDVYVQGLVRRREGQWHVTVFLVNAQQEPKKGKDTAWLFQPELVVEAPDAAAIFQRRPLPQADPDPEQQAMAMRYRRQVEFAVGHGVAVQADLAPETPDCAVRLRTVVVPTYELGQTLPRDVPGLTLDMQALSQVPDGHFAAHLAPLAAAYAAWIAHQSALIPPVPPSPSEFHSPPFPPFPPSDPSLSPYRDVAQAALAQARRTLARIEAGIALLDADPQAAEAFRFANQAMALQRTHTVAVSRVRQGQPADWEAIDQPANRSWRTFQLAFLLLNLPALATPTHPERTLHAPPSASDHDLPFTDHRSPITDHALADLLWFPTGGGKTEAYLGVAAFAMAIRRLQGEVGGRSGHAGVAVLMRYTLRLLTLQQFQRAAALICACEHIRRSRPALWGDEPFRLGLWVGQRSTPNWTSDAADAVKQLRHSGHFSGGTPYQLSNCPWCGAPINPGQHIEVIKFEQGAGRTVIYCGDPLGQCEFSKRCSPSEGIPALVVDEEIYRRLPTLLIATVDKFAQMPWNGRAAMLFGQVDGYCERHGYRSPETEDSDTHPAKASLGLPRARTLPAQPLRPPDLVIQDELHLISGPLGTLVGLYETAVDSLCAWQVDGVEVRPKVIASTATVRRAASQVHSLFLRRVEIFPPPGLDATDNFFAYQVAPSEAHPGRRYLGVYAPGVRHKSALIRTYTAYLAAAQKLYLQYGLDADPWMTLVGYFNALRELGGMRRAVDDSISARLHRMDRRGLARRFLNPYAVKELTSRLSAAEIPAILDRLETVFDPAAEAARKQSKRDDSARYPIDVLLATNMISVGVDVGRLGLMVVAGQPKTTAEYIQATSRVGRRFPGLVCTVYNWTRPRDISHYERFGHYHATFYQNVEALSVTPFSAGAVQRGLSAVLASLVRLQSLRYNANAAAAGFDRHDTQVQAAVDQIAWRAGQLNGPAVEDLVRSALAYRLDTWQAAASASTGAQLGYQTRRDGATIGLLRAPEDGAWETFTCLNSLRDVEPTVNLILDNYGMERGEERAARSDV